MLVIILVILLLLLLLRLLESAAALLTESPPSIALRAPRRITRCARGLPIRAPRQTDTSLQDIASAANFRARTLYPN